MSEHKATKSELFTEIQTILADAGHVDLADVMGKEVASLAAKAAKAKEAAAKKAATVDEFKAIVAGALTDEFQSGADVFAAVGYVDDEDANKSLTLGKVRARLTALVKEGSVVKDSIKATDAEDKTHTVMGYKLAE